MQTQVKRPAIVTGHTRNAADGLETLTKKIGHGMQTLQCIFWDWAVGWAGGKDAVLRLQRAMRLSWTVFGVPCAASKDARPASTRLRERSNIMKMQLQEDSL